VVFGIGSLQMLGELARDLGGARILVVTDPGIVAAGHVARAVASTQAAGLHAFVFADVEENPTTRHVDLCVAAARSHQIDMLVALGGGSPMDTAKGANFVLSNGGRIADYWGVGKATRPMLPLIAVPTTAGTGSEAQSFALIADEVTHQKMACGDKKAACRIAVLDPTLTVSQPPIVTAASGMDAIAHAVESFVTTRRNSLSQLFSRAAWTLLCDGFPRVLENPEDLDARSQMLLGAHYAGIAIENSMLGAAHAAANPLTAQYGITHGVAVGLMLPHVVRLNANVCDPLYAELLGTNHTAAADRLANRLRELLARAGIGPSLSALGVEKKDLPTLAAVAARQWTAQFNPRPVGPADFEHLYERAYNGP
jgi:alcohol dehydrogenase